MARKKAKGRSRRKFTGVNVVNAAEAYIQANWITQGFAGTDPLAFLIGKTSQGYGALVGVSDTGGQSRVGLTELLGFGNKSAQANLDTVIANVRANWFDVLLKGAITTASFKVGKKLFSRQRRQINKGLKMLGAGTFLKV
jgi:hypothetical protein